MTSAADRLATLSLARGVPLSAHVDLTMRCNERCVHCYRVVESRPELTGDEVRGLLAELAEAGTLYLTFSGGEIFLRADVLDLVAHAKRLRFDVAAYRCIIYRSIRELETLLTRELERLA